MAANRHISKIIIALTAIAVLLCFLAIGYADKLNKLFGGSSVTMEYESKLFNTDEVISIDIQMDEDEWEKMLANASSEEYYVCDVVINGKKIRNVAIRPKGNTSLSAIMMDPDSDRFSLKLEFDHFVDGQTCFGLDKLILNNNYADATNMKEAIIYDMFQYLGADASLYNYAEVSVNGEYWGVYLALEGVEQSFMLRNYGTQDGELYKPDTMEMGGGSSSSSSGPSMPGMSFPSGGGSGFGGMTPPSGDFPSDGNFEMPEGSFPGNGERPEGNGFNFNGGGRPDGESEGDPSSSGFPSGEKPEGFSFSGEGRSEGGFSFDSENMPDMGDFDPSEMGGGFSMGGNGGANLNYTDDDLDSYSTIWEAEITGTSKNDHRRVVTALKNISEGNDLEKYLDVDNVLKYMAVHTFAVNMDSLSGSMSHNYYLYEYDGQLNILPWDYNLSLGGMSMNSNNTGTDIVNDAIDTPFSGTKFFDSLLENDEYRERYHEYLQQLVDEYVNGGRFDEVYSRIRNQIDELVKNDPTAFFSYEEYDKATGILYEIIKLRAESIDGQIKGTIPSTDAGQREDSSALIDASHLDVSAMGEFDMGGFSDRDSDEDPDSEEGGRPEMGGFDFSNMDFPFDGERPSADGMMPSFGNQYGGISKIKNLLVFGACLLGMLVALFIVKRNKRVK
ncbi:MAG: CotH kinase family protein [Erysipelotrichaceae bacterium]|nr:CotH kinase family protein [Erysipelotrichaceae bacterium]MBQ6493143.1 CotH kinase family protein [Erysipelotrichaceae bacterium]